MSLSDLIKIESAFAEAAIDPTLWRQAPDIATRESSSPIARYCAPRLAWGYEVERVRQRIAARAGLINMADLPLAGELRGFTDLVRADRIGGWAQNTHHPDAPVCVDIIADGRLIGQVLANRYREDLEKAGINNGCHAFVFTPPPEIEFARMDVRRSIDGAGLMVGTQGEARVDLNLRYG